MKFSSLQNNVKTWKSTVFSTCERKKLVFEYENNAFVIIYKFFFPNQGGQVVKGVKNLSKIDWHGFESHKCKNLKT